MWLDISDADDMSADRVLQQTAPHARCGYHQWVDACMSYASFAVSLLQQLLLLLRPLAAGCTAGLRVCDRLPYVVGGGS